MAKGWRRALYINAIKDMPPHKRSVTGHQNEWIITFPQHTPVEPGTLLFLRYRVEWWCWWSWSRSMVPKNAKKETASIMNRWLQIILLHVNKTIINSTVRMTVCENTGANIPIIPPTPAGKYTAVYHQWKFCPPFHHYQVVYHAVTTPTTRQNADETCAAGVMATSPTTVRYRFP